MKKTTLATLLALTCQGLLLTPTAQAESRPSVASAPAAQPTLGAGSVVWLQGDYQPEPRRWQQNIPADLAPALAAIEAKNYAEALRLLPEGNELAPEAALLKAEALLAQGQNDAAQLLLERALTTYYLLPSNPMIAQQVAMKTGRPTQPLHALAPRLATLLVRTFLRQGNEFEARRAFANTTFNDREYLLAHGDFARLTSQVQEARGAYRQVLKLDPGNKEAQAALQQLKKFGKAQNKPTPPATAR